MVKKISNWLLSVFGWKKVGTFPVGIKCVVIAAPHTSNWDYVIGMLYYLSEGIRARVMIKKELFFFPLGIILKAFGGIPVDRHRKTDIVEKMIERFNNDDLFVLALTPEGTRKRVTEWKSGFYRIALGAKVPILLGFFDYKNRQVGTGELVKITGDMDSDLKRIMDFYSEKSPLYPEKFSIGTFV